MQLDAKTPNETLAPIVSPDLNPTGIRPASDCESRMSELSGIKKGG